MKIENRLHPLFEIIGLTYYRRHREELKAQTIEELEQLGVNGQLFWESNYSFILSYAEDFERKYVSHLEENFLFGSMDMDCTYALFAAIAENPHWAEAPDLVSDEEILAFFAQILSNDFADQTAPDISTPERQMKFLDRQEISDSAKWKLMMLFRDPKHWLTVLAEIFRQNLPAFEYALEKNQKAIAQKISVLQSEGIRHEAYSHIIGEITGITSVYPSVISPVAEWGLLTTGFYGIWVNKVFGFNDIREQEKLQLLQSMKLLSDKSKFEILSLLKNGPKYNLEIAEKLGISTATASHHMSLLLSGGFVTVEKNDGRVYYRLQSSQIRDALKLLEKYFSL